MLLCTQEGVGLIAVNDSLWIESTLYKILQKHFRKEQYYADIVDLFHETTYQTEVGQSMDLLTSPDNHVDFSMFTMERYTPPDSFCLCVTTLA